MAANYNLYDNIDIGSLSGSVTSLKGELTSKQSELENFKGEVEGSTWKSDDNSKKTLTDGYEKIITNAYKPLLEKLDNVITVCDNIKTYRDARESAKKNKSDLEGYKNDTTIKLSQETIRDFNAEIKKSEDIMNACEKEINSICGR